MSFPSSTPECIRHWRQLRRWDEELESLGLYLDVGADPQESYRVHVRWKDTDDVLTSLAPGDLVPWLDGWKAARKAR